MWGISQSFNLQLCRLHVFIHFAIFSLLFVIYLLNVANKDKCILHKMFHKTWIARRSFSMIQGRGTWKNIVILIWKIW